MMQGIVWKIRSNGCASQQCIRSRLIANKRTAICGCERGHHCKYVIAFLADPCHAGLDCEHSLKNLLNCQKYLHVLSYIFVLPFLSVYILYFLLI